MTNEAELARRKKLTFEQAEGLEELPRQLKRNEMPNTLRARLLKQVTDAASAEADQVGQYFAFGPDWEGVFRSLWAGHLGIVSASFYPTRENVFSVLEEVFKDWPAPKVYGFIQAIVRLARSADLSQHIAEILADQKSAYRLIDGDTLVPFGSDQEAHTVLAALDDASAQPLPGARTHLRQSTLELSNGEFANSVRESMHAVELTLRSLTGEPSVSKALNELARRRPLHEAFKRGIAQLYGYSSDEPGIRHPLLEKGDAGVSEEDAMVMLGICASLVTYFSRSYGAG